MCGPMSALPRLRRGSSGGAGRRDQLRDLGRQRPAQDDDARRSTAATGTAPAAASVRQAMASVATMSRVKTVSAAGSCRLASTSMQRAEAIDRQHDRRQRIDLARLGRGTVEQAGDDQRG